MMKVWVWGEKKKEEGLGVVEVGVFGLLLRRKRRSLLAESPSEREKESEMEKETRRDKKKRWLSLLRR